MTALIVVDVQNDFCEGGALPVFGGNYVAYMIRDWAVAFRNEYSHILFTADWHNPLPDTNGGHFAVEDAPDFTDTWPVHCVKWTHGSDFHPAIVDLQYALGTNMKTEIFRKGQGRPDYSGFQGFNDSRTPLEKYLFDNGVTDIEVCGIAGDFCVRHTALDAVKRGATVKVLSNMVASVGEITATRAMVDEVNRAQYGS